MRLLMVEDDPRLAAATAKGLQAAGFAVDHVETVDEAEAALAVGGQDAMVLDLGLPDGDGLALLADLRGRDTALPVLVLTARDGVADRIDGLNRGADDYLVKPFAMDELVARLRALLRRPGAALGVVLEYEGLSYDTVHQQASYKGETLKLSRRELGLLEHLMRRAGNVVPKSLIEERLYGFEEEVGANTIEVLVHRLRKKLEKAGSAVAIHTVRGVGYILAGDLK